MILNLAKITLTVMNGLVSQEFEHTFLKEKLHKTILIQLVHLGIEKSNELNYYTNSNCKQCLVNNRNIINQFLSIFSNICLNNYISDSTFFS